MEIPAGLPRAQGLYDPRSERDACGVGFVAHIKGKKSHDIVSKGLTILNNLTHRGATGADPLHGDGAGILVQNPDAFFREEMAGQGVRLPKAVHFGMRLGRGEEGLRSTRSRAVVVGHCYPIWLRFKGGKGVATAFGAFVVLAPLPALVALGVWIVVLALGRWVSLASLFGAAVFPLLAAVLEKPGHAMLLGVSLASALIIVRHRNNIRQLTAGSEPRIGRRD